MVRLTIKALIIFFVLIELGYSENIQAFAPILRLYASNPTTPGLQSNSGYKFIHNFFQDL